ncbi:MAG TPA: hypothetical protein DDW86_04300 [Clostridiales bacterium]|nr:hypothetical protein [Clostridiales bacterium]
MRKTNTGKQKTERKSRMEKYRELTGLCLMPGVNNDKLEAFRQKYINDPSKVVPMHITLLNRFFLPGAMNAEIVNKLKAIAGRTQRFEFWAKPLSCFPTSNVLYLTPSPLAPVEAMTQALYDAFPEYHTDFCGFSTYHMTIALGNPKKKMDDIIKEYQEIFEYKPLRFEARSLDMFHLSENKWTKCLSFDLA